MLLVLIRVASGLASPAAVASLTQWFEASGGGHDGVEAAPCGDAGWGLVSTRSIAKGEIVVSTPRHLLLCDGPAWLDAAVTPQARIACRVLDDPSNPYMDALPGWDDLATLPALWDDDYLLAGTQSGRSRLELLERWYDEWERINAFDWQDFRYAQALVMSRGYNVGDDYAVIPFVDFVNHADEPDVDLIADANAMMLVARRDMQQGEQVFASYDREMDALKKLQAFGWLPEDAACCSLDCVESIKADDELGNAKLTLVEAAPHHGRLILDLQQPIDERCRDALVGFRLCAMHDDEFLDVIDDCEHSNWFKRDVVSADNERAAVASAINLVSRKLQEMDANAARRATAARNAPDPRQAALATAVAFGERRALVAFRDWLHAY